MYYLLDENRIPQSCTVEEWAAWFAEVGSGRVMRKTTLDNVEVSTVFMGIDHGYDENSAPLLFETMVFGGECDKDLWRYSTYDEAEAGHEAAVQRVIKNSTNLRVQIEGRKINGRSHDHKNSHTES